MTANILEADLLGQAVEFTYKDTTYKVVNPITIGIESAFARWCYTSALAELKQMNDLYQMTDGEEGLNDEMYEKALDRVNDQLCKGQFSWGSTLVSSKVNSTWVGVHYMMYLRFRQYQPKFKLSTIVEIFNDPEALSRLKQTLNPTQAEDPNKQK